MFVRERKRVIWGIELGGMEDLGVRLWGHDGLLILIFGSLLCLYTYISHWRYLIQWLMLACLID